MVTVDYTLGPAAVEEIQALYGSYAWWADREEGMVRQALAATDEIVGVRESGTLVASARILTDYTYYAQVFDVIVAADRRGEGFGETLMAGVVDHPGLEGLEPSLVAREGLIEFYEACGFEELGPIDHPDGAPEPMALLKYRSEE